ncbi:MAG: glycoside hydrolase family 16 protein [Gemmatimonadaceae bacterium]|nr:glycoside hydrolase family 16 protein [Gemmatimonadaceae bacterium]NUR19174.1 glycoside hydrolase family 16 protein [Gemmatimonadaceae bacterium]NUS96120.1 glycoside hydrolase family 16 protein [Gemmatimonadaceae bacterium]
MRVAPTRAAGALASLAFAALACVPRAALPPVPAGTRVLFADDFDAPALDRSKWNVEVRGAAYNDEQQAYVDSAPTVYVTHGAEAAGASGGVLVIAPRWAPGYVSADGHRHDFVSGHLDTRGRFEFTYGTASARMKLPAGAGFWPAFWLLGTGDWPATGEIDVMENVGEPDWSSVALHGPGYSGDTPLFNRLYLPQGDDATRWHVYSVDWGPDTLVFRVDDTIVYRATRPMIENYGKWSYDNPKFMILNLALGGAYPLKTNGVRAPYPGLPASTVDVIKRGEGKVYVDWVRVTARR